MKAILTLYILLFFVFSAKSQIECEFIKLCSQTQVDSFPKKYGHCEKVFSVEVDDNCNWVYNLDSLYGLIEIGELRILRMDSLSSISGLNNLKKVGRIRMVQRANFEPFLNLDTIIFLTHVFGRPNLDLSIYQNVKHIDSSFSVLNSGLLTGNSSFTCSSEFNLTVYENKLKNETGNLIPSNVSNISTLYISRNDSLNLKGCEAFQEVDKIIIDRNKNSDFTSLANLKRINKFEIGLENFNNNTYPRFDSIKNLERLVFINMENLKNLDILFPNLTSITSALYLTGNKHLVDIKKLDNFSIPHEKLYDTIFYKNRITITDNPFLADCINPYVCKALETYPDSFVIQNNGANCEKEQLIQDCLTSADQEEITQTISFFPNPVFDKLYWKEEEVIHQLDIFDLSGKVLYSIQRPSSGLDISHLDAGVYLVKMQTQNQSFTSRICVAR